MSTIAQSSHSVVEQTQEIEKISSRLAQKLFRPVKLMPVSGVQSSIAALDRLNSIDNKHLEFVQGYGQAAWSLPVDRVDIAMAIARRTDAILATYPEVIGIRGKQESLAEAKVAGTEMILIENPLEVLEIAAANPDKKVVFFAVGFEDRVASTAQAVLQAEASGIDNFLVYGNHTLLLPALKAILDSPSMRIDGFIASEEIASVVGLAPYRHLAKYYHKPIAIAGAGPTDMFQGSIALLKQLESDRAEVENLAGVSEEGNTEALQAICQVFEPREFYEWRGMGSIDFSGLRLRSDYVKYDAEVQLRLPKLKIADAHSAQCMTIVTGVFQPCQCKVFGAGCTPKTPMGTYMTSEDGICVQHFKVYAFAAIGSAM